jgi:hypothetical protein
MSGKKEVQHVNMAGVTSLGRKERPAGSKSARRGGASKSLSSGESRTSARGRR